MWEESRFLTDLRESLWKEAKFKRVTFLDLRISKCAKRASRPSSMYTVVVRFSKIYLFEITFLQSRKESRFLTKLRESIFLPSESLSVKKESHFLMLSSKESRFLTIECRSPKIVTFLMFLEHGISLTLTPVLRDSQILTTKSVSVKRVTFLVVRISVKRNHISWR